MTPARRRGVILIEPDINPVTRRFSLPNIANYPPLPQARLAGQLGQEEEVEIADLRIAGERERLLDRVRSDPPGLVGISLTFTSNGDEAIAVAAAIRSVAPATTIVLGGTAPSEDPASFWDSAADLICFRNGDAAFAALAAEIRGAGRPPERFPGFFHREDGRWVLDPGPAAAPLASLRPYAWHLLPRRYWREYFQGFRPTGMSQTSEGCPYDCTFCTVWKTHGRRVSLASLANVQHDLTSLPAAIRAFFFADDIWMQASERQIRELYDPLLEWMASDFLPRRPDFWLTVETRTDLYLREEDRFKAWIRRGGLKRILFGVEAVTDEQLKNFSKRNTVDKNIEAIRRAAETGAIVTAQFVIPCDATRAYFDEMVRFLKTHRRWIRTSNFTVATPLPGTDLYAESLKDSPELADRKAVSHPAFSLFTALTPTRLDVREFYEQVARVFRAANQIFFSLDAERQVLRMVVQSPWLIRRLAKAPLALRALTNPGTFLDVHRMVQGDRLLAPRSMMEEGPTPIGKEKSMKTIVGVWIDHRKAVIAVVSDKGEETRVIDSNVERQPGRVAGVRSTTPYESQKVQADDSREREFTGHLHEYYDEVIAAIRDAGSILIFGPGEAKGELKRRLERDRLDGRIVAVETVDKMTDRQIAAKVREYSHR